MTRDPLLTTTRSRALYANVVRHAPSSLEEQRAVLLDLARRQGASTRDVNEVMKQLNADHNIRVCRG